MTPSRPGAEARRTAARRLGARWTGLHRQEEEATRASPLYKYVFQRLPGVVITAAGVGLVHLVTGGQLTLLQMLAVGATGVAGAAWGGVVLVRRRRALRDSRVIYTRPERGRIRDRTR